VAFDPATSGPAAEAAARARFLLGEITYAQFRNFAAKPDDVVGTVDGKVALLQTVDRAFCLGDRLTWTPAGPWPGSRAWRTPTPSTPCFCVVSSCRPGWGRTRASSSRVVIENQAADADARAAEARTLCSKKAKGAMIVTEAARSCLLGEPHARCHHYVPAN